MMERKQYIREMDELTDTYCEGCLVKQTLTKERSKTNAHRFCITECSIGLTIQKIGEAFMQQHKKG